MLSKLSPGVSNLNDQISIDRREVIASFKNLRKFRAYAAGIHDTTLTVDQQKMLEGVLGNDYSDNMSGQCLSEHSDRLELKRITAKVESSSTDPESTEKAKGQSEQEWIDIFWQKQNFDDLQQRVHYNTLRDGNYCLMVEYDPEKDRIVLHREEWWDGYMGVFIGYDTYGDMLYAVKEWETPEGRRRTIYYEGALERYLSAGGGSIWTPFVLPEDQVGAATGTQASTEPVPIPYVDSFGNAIHIPFIHFTNPSPQFENYGSSFLDGGLIGAQDQITDTQYDISATARMNGYQRTWSKGFKLQKINGKTVKPKTGPGVHYHAEEDNAAWGVLEAGSIDQLISTYKHKAETFCRNTRTPYASITGNWPSGEALYRTEKPIYAATKARQKRNSGPWVRVMHRAMELANIYQNAGLDEDIILTAVYSDAGDRDPLSMAMADLNLWQAAVAAVQAGMPLETFLKVQGWGDDQLVGLSTDIINQIRQRQEDLMNSAPENTPTTGGTSGATTSKATSGGARRTGGHTTTPKSSAKGATT